MEEVLFVKQHQKNCGVFVYDLTLQQKEEKQQYLYSLLLQPYSINYLCLIISKIGYIQENITKQCDIYNQIKLLDPKLNFLQNKEIRLQLSHLEVAQIYFGLQNYQMAEIITKNYIRKTKYGVKIGNENTSFQDYYQNKKQMVGLPHFLSENYQGKLNATEKQFKEQWQDTMDDLSNFYVHSVKKTEGMKSEKEMEIEFEQEQEQFDLTCLMEEEQEQDKYKSLFFQREIESLALAYYIWGNIKMMQNQYFYAIQHYKHSVLYDQKLYLGYLNIGFCQSRCFRTDEAMRSYTKSIEINPLNYIAYHNVGMQYYALSGDHRQALPYFLKSIEINPKYDKGNMLLYRYYQIKQKNQQCFLGQIELGGCYIKEKNISKAIHHYLQALHIDIDNMHKIENFKMRVFIVKLFKIILLKNLETKVLCMALFRLVTHRLGKMIYRFDIIKEVAEYLNFTNDFSPQQI